jgi:hypothetical protein
MKSGTPAPRHHKRDLGNDSWRERALCALPQFCNLNWFPERTGEINVKEKRRKREEIAFLRKICRHCPVQAECRLYAERSHASLGIWAGKDYASS